MILQITLGDIIGWIITITSFGITIGLNIKIKSYSNKINQKLDKGNNTATINV